MKGLSPGGADLFLSYLDFEIERLMKERQKLIDKNEHGSGFLLSKTEAVQCEVIKKRFLKLLDEGEDPFREWLAECRRKSERC
jgi:hypothetical protein